MSNRDKITRITSSREHKFLELVESIERERDPVGAATYEVTAGRRAYAAQQVSNASVRRGRVATAKASAGAIHDGAVGNRRHKASKVSKARINRAKASTAEATGFERLVESIHGSLDLPRPASVVQALRNAELRKAFLAEIGALTAAEVAQIAGSKAKNTSALASRWRSEHRIFAVPWGGELLFPAFQFSDGEPRPVIGRVLEEFGDRSSGWEIALWFATPSEYLPHRTSPIERLDDPETLIAAARSELITPAF